MASRPDSPSQPARRDHDEHPDDRALDRLADRGPSRVGIDGAAPAVSVDRDAAALAAVIAPRRSAPWLSAAASTPQKQSPAPVVSTTVAGSPGT